MTSVTDATTAGQPVLTASRAWPRPVALVSAADAAGVGCVHGGSPAANAPHPPRGSLHVITATAVVLAAMDPPILTVAVAAQSRIRTIAESGGGFAVSLLAADAAHLAQRFATGGRPADTRQLAGLGWRPAPVSGAPLLDRHVVAWFDCRLRGVVGVPGAPGQVLLAGRIAASARCDIAADPHDPDGVLLRAEGEYQGFPLPPVRALRPTLVGVTAGGR